jgi:hypothetical protein
VTEHDIERLVTELAACAWRWPRCSPRRTSPACLALLLRLVG